MAEEQALGAGRAGMGKAFGLARAEASSLATSGFGVDSGADFVASGGGVLVWVSSLGVFLGVAVGVFLGVAFAGGVLELGVFLAP